MHKTRARGKREKEQSRIPNMEQKHAKRGARMMGAVSQTRPAGFLEQERAETLSGRIAFMSQANAFSSFYWC